MASVIGLKHSLEAKTLEQLIPNKKIRFEDDEEIELQLHIPPNQIIAQVNAPPNLKEEKPAPLSARRWTYEQFKEACSNLNTCPNFNERLERFKQIFEKGADKDGDEEWKLQLQIPAAISQNNSEFFIDLVMNQGPFDSMFMGEKYQNAPNKSREGQKYWFLEAHPEGNRETEKVYFEMRFNTRGEVGELLKLKKCAGMSGSQMRDVCFRIKDCLIRKLFLNDDSKIEGTSETDSMFMRFFMPIVYEIPTTFYSGVGCKVWKFENVENMEGEPLLPQDPDIYAKAVNLIRETTLDELVSLYTKYEDIASLNELRLRYTLNEKPCMSVHELGWSIFARSLGKIPCSEPDKIQAQKDFKTYYKLAFYYEGKRPRTNYVQALKILDTYKFWVKMD